MKNVMTKAWEIAKEGVKKFGGKVKEYFTQALVMAWAEVKKGGNTVKDKMVVAFNEYVEEMINKGFTLVERTSETEVRVEFKEKNLNDVVIKMAKELKDYFAVVYVNDKQFRSIYLGKEEA